MLAGGIVAMERSFTTDPSRWLRQLTHRLGEPVIQSAMRQAMRIFGTEFVRGRTIEEALERSDSDGLYSYDMVGAVVGSQPFGGQGLSGTGPKAGGPHYLARFATEKVLTISTTATGGNAELLSLGDS